MNLETFTHRLNELYQPVAGRFSLVDVPEMNYLMIDGTGDPQGEAFQAAVKRLFSLAHLIKPFIREKLGARFVEPPLECLFWSDEGSDFSSLPKGLWKWRLMIVVLDWVTEDFFQEVSAKVAHRLGPAPAAPRLAAYHEGPCAQILHVGDYAGISSVSQALYRDFLPANHLQPNGPYHEIYLNDPSRVGPEKRRLVLRQPVAARGTMASL